MKAGDTVTITVRVKVGGVVTTHTETCQIDWPSAPNARKAVLSDLIVEQTSFIIGRFGSRNGASAGVRGAGT